jgi:hypothetical protein
MSEARGELERGKDMQEWERGTGKKLVRWSGF